MIKHLLLLLSFITIAVNAQFTENFEAYTVGAMNNQNTTLWNTWSGTNTDTPIAVVNNNAYSGSQSGYVSNGTDALLLLGNKTTGSWVLKLDMYVPTNKEGYINVQGLINANGGTQGEFLSGNIYFNKQNLNPGVVLMKEMV